MRQYIACAVTDPSGDNGSPAPIEIGLVDERGVVRYHAHRRTESGTLRSGLGMVEEVTDVLSEPIVYAFDGSATCNQLTTLAETGTTDGFNRRPTGGGAAADVEDLEWRSLQAAATWDDAIPGQPRSLESACRAAGIAVGPNHVRRAVHRALLTRLLHSHLLSAARQLKGTFRVASTDTESDTGRSDSDSTGTRSPSRTAAVPDPDVILPGLPTDLHDLQTDSDTSILPMTDLPPVYVATDRPPSANVATGIALLDNEGSPILSEVLRPARRARRAALLTREDVDEDVRAYFPSAPPYDRLRRMLRRHLLGRNVRIWAPDGFQTQIQTLHTGLPGPNLPPLAKRTERTATPKSNEQMAGREPPESSDPTGWGGSAPRTWADELRYVGIRDRWMEAGRLDTQPSDSVFDAAQACRKTFSPPEMNGSNTSGTAGTKERNRPLSAGLDSTDSQKPTGSQAQRSAGGPQAQRSGTARGDGSWKEVEPEQQGSDESPSTDAGPADRALARAEAARAVDRYLRGC